MEYEQPSLQQSLHLLQALKYVVGHLKLGGSQRLIDAAQQYWLQTNWSWETLAPMAEAQLYLLEPRWVNQLIQSVVVLMVVEGCREQPIFFRAQRLVQALKITCSGLRYLDLWCHGRDRQLALEVYWHSFIAQKYRFEYRQRGWRWLVYGVLTYQGIWQNRSMAQKYHQLRFYPSDTLGYQFWSFCQHHQIKFPGERWGLHEGLLFHDMTHVLGGFDTTDEGELLTVALTAGYQQHGDALASLLFVLLQHHAGVQIGILSKAHKGVLSQPG